MVFTVLRSLADVILVGAGTVRTERYRPVQGEQIWLGLRPGGAALPAIAIVSASLDLDPTAPLLTRAAPGSQTIVITAAAAPADRKAALRQNARVIDSGEKRVDMAAAIRALADLGFRNILTEGGPVLLGHLVKSGLVDELCLTTSPVLAGGSTDRIVALGEDEPATPLQLKLAHVLADDGYLLSRYLRAR
jgi:5-amino-6-(5-phosphoribosylamino)uracil reductase